MTVPESYLSAVLVVLALWLAIGFCGLLRQDSLRLVARVLFPLSALCGAALAVVAALGIASPAERLTLVIGLPDLPMHVRLDALSCVFLFLLGAVSTGISMFAAGYFRKGQGTAPGLLCLQYHLFLAAMGFVLVADDAYGFMVAWETMALSSYFLVTAQHGLPEIRRAGFLYLLIAHVGALAILLSFGVMQGGSWQFTFDAMRAAHLSPRLGGGGVRPRAGRLRRQGRPAAPARLAARSAPGRAVAGLRADERHHAEDRGVRHAARDLRPARRPALVVGPHSGPARAWRPRSSAWCSRRRRPT